jgi:hypothetical protein
MPLSIHPLPSASHLFLARKVRLKRGTSTTLRPRARARIYTSLVHVQQPHITKNHTFSPLAARTCAGGQLVLSSSLVAAYITSEGGNGKGWKGGERTALERRHLSARAGCFFGADAFGAVVSSAAGHVDVVWLVVDRYLVGRIGGGDDYQSWMIE